MENIITSEGEKKNALIIFNEIKNLEFLNNEWIIILADSINSYNNWQYFWSISTITMFFEKYLRDILIKLEREISWKRSEKEYLKYLEEIEKNIEDWGSKYNFYNICDTLYIKNKINYEYFKNLTDMYKQLRTPVQHGIYQRLIKNQIPNAKIPVMKFSFSEDLDHITDKQKEYEFIDAMNKAWNIENYNEEYNNSHPMMRQFILQRLFKQRSLELFIFAKSLISYIK